MFRLNLEEILDLPYPSILAYLRSKCQIEGSNEIGSGLRNEGYENIIITAFKSYSTDYLLQEDDRDIVQSPDFISTVKLSNTELIQMISEQNKDISIFTNKAEMLRYLLRSDGDLMTFGSNQFGQLGLSITSEIKTIPTLVNLEEKVRSVSCGSFHTAIITKNGNLMTFGSNSSHGRLGQGIISGRDSDIPKLVQLENDEKVESVSCGPHHTAIITESGRLMTFGSNVEGQLGLGEETKRLRPTLVQIPNNEIPNNERVKMVSCGDNYTAIITESGQLITFGDNLWGQLGLGNSGQGTNRSKPELVNIPNNEKVKMVSCGGSHTAIITEDGPVDLINSTLYPRSASLMLGKAAISLNTASISEAVHCTSARRSRGLLSNTVGCLSQCDKQERGSTGPMLGKLMTFGYNSHGQLGLGHKENRSRPTLVNLTEKVKMVSCGTFHTAIITESGNLMTFGSNLFGRLGLNDTQHRTRPTLVRIPNKKKVKMVSCGDTYTAIITNDGKLMTVGDNDDGELGLGYYGRELVLVPTLVESVKDKNVKMVSCGRSNTAIIVESLD